MTFLTSTKIKLVIKKKFPFVSYRWKIYEVLLAFPIIKKRWKIYAAFRRVANFLYYKYWQTKAELDLSQGFFTLQKHKLTIKEIDESNKDALIKFAQENFNNNMYVNWIFYFIKNEYRGRVALLHDEIIGYLWWWTHDQGVHPPPEILFYNVKVKKGDAYGFNFFIAPQFRGHGNSIEFLSRHFSMLRSLGYKNSTGIHGTDSLPVSWTYRLVGFKETRIFPVYAFFGHRLVFNEKAVFLRNPSWHSRYPFEYRLLFSLRR